MERSQLDVFIDGSQTLDEFITVVLSTFTVLKRPGGYIDSSTLKDTMRDCMRWGALYQERKGGKDGINERTEAGSNPESSS
jgi:hypothetical protein